MTHPVAELEAPPELAVLELGLDLLAELLVRHLLALVDVAAHGVAEVAHELVGHDGRVALVLLWRRGRGSGSVRVRGGRNDEEEKERGTHELVGVLDGEEGRDAEGDVDLLDVLARAREDAGPLVDKLAGHLVLGQSADRVLGEEDGSRSATETVGAKDGESEVWAYPCSNNVDNLLEQLLVVLFVL